MIQSWELLEYFENFDLLFNWNITNPHILCRVIQPICMRLFISSFTNSSNSKQQVTYAAGVCVAAFLHVVLHHAASFRIYHIGMKCRVAASALIYRKVCLYILYSIVSLIFYIVLNSSCLNTNEIPLRLTLMLLLYWTYPYLH